MKFLVISLSLLSLISCAVMNTATTETAEVLSPGMIKVGYELSTGVDLKSVVFLPEDSTGTYDSQALNSITVNSLKLGVGIIEDFEVDAKFWTYYGGSGQKYGIKYQLPFGDDKHKFAFSPAISIVKTSNYDDEEEDWIDNLVGKAKVISYEFPFISTYRPHKNFALTNVIRYSQDNIELKFHDSLEKLSGDYNLERIDVIIGLSFDARIFYLRPDFGCTVARRNDSKWGVVPIIGLGLGLDPAGKE